jgi:tRNA G10  N-methylase Trm11
VDAVITSPPFFSTKQEKFPIARRGYDEGFKWHKKMASDHKGVDMVYTDNPQNIENTTELGSVDAIITSPPFGEANRGAGIAKKGYEGRYGKDEKMHLRHDRPLSENPENISNLPYESVDAIITSPPFATSDMRKSKLFLKMREQPNSKWYNRSLNGNAVKYYLSEGYSVKENIGNLPYEE